MRVYACAGFLKIQIMYRLITEISQRCYETANRRGKDTSCVGCLKYLHTELGEYWKAVETDKIAPNINDLVQQATELPDDEFTALYAEKMHNTTTDELADILIVAASWYEAAKRDTDGEFAPAKSLDVMLLSGAIHFVFDRTNCDPADIELVRQVVNLKMRYNETRND